ncbi:MAG TPA: GNAT family N-acetyltransferase [Pirellulaceae bacterium]|jgi:GNAT superfamily N-acetyltransferase|nr:GNAT family N-acetyltransferase [Pirellulaceae bacterium]
MNSRPSDFSVTDSTESPDAGAALVRKWLREFNLAANGPFMEKLGQPEFAAKALALTAHMASAIVGGLLGETQLAWLRLSIMAVDPACRSRGIGSALLAEAERIAVERGCRYAFVDTMEYQAPGFYRRCGYALAGQIPDWDSHGHAKLYFTKRLVVGEATPTA